MIHFSYVFTYIQQTLKWPSLQCHREYHKCIQIYKCISGLASAYLLDDFHSLEQIHKYNTRKKTLSICLLPKQLNFKHLLSKAFSSDSSPSFQPVTPAEIELEILSIPNNKSSGLYS